MIGRHVPEAMGRVAFNDAGFDGVGGDVAEKTNGARGRSGTASDDGLSPQLFGLIETLSDHDVLEDLVDVGLGEILNPPGSQKQNNNIIIMWRSMRPVSMTIVDGFFARLAEARLRSDGSDLSFDTG
ncbi:hypothetical protein ABID62_006696 [Bradyrhizobium sp. S3.9.1]